MTPREALDQLDGDRHWCNPKANLRALRVLRALVARDERWQQAVDHFAGKAARRDQAQR